MSIRTRSTRFRAVARLVAASALLASAASATWSIVAVNTRTGEVCIASATCISDINLEGLTPVLRVGVGGACSQSLGDSSGILRKRIWNGLIAGATPEEILEELKSADSGAPRRQFGIVNMADDPVSFSGPMCGQAVYQLARVDGDLRYAIQGNVLTGIQVITNAEEAFLATEGDLGQKVMASMEAARVFGGDGRCSCLKGNPTGCGCPPVSFVYSAYTAFFILARMGDVDDDACPDFGCVGGQYFCNLNAISGFDGPEPVLLLESFYADWRLSRQGRTDHIQTRVTPRVGTLPPDGTSQLTVDVELRDVEGNPVSTPGATLSIAQVSGGLEIAQAGDAQEVSPGLHRFVVEAGSRPGEARWQITVQQGGESVLLWPELAIRVRPDLP